ncbi:protein of unknown function [Pseudomonas sp. JV551A1]|nr:protein of unknown function [Pseudomonas sp. JV551A1]
MCARHPWQRAAWPEMVTRAHFQRQSLCAGRCLLCEPVNGVGSAGQAYFNGRLFRFRMENTCSFIANGQPCWWLRSACGWARFTLNNGRKWPTR